MIFQTAETRSLILEAAQKLFLEKGFFDAQMLDVVAATGLSRTSLYRYFQDKNDLAMALLGKISERLGEDSRAWLEHPSASAQKPSALDAVAAYLKGHWLSDRFRDEFVFLAEFDAYFAGSRVPPDFKEEVGRAMGGQGDATLDELLARAEADGSMRPGLDRHLVAITLLNGVRGLQQRLLLRGDALAEARGGELELMPGLLVNLLIEGLRNLEGGKS
jgi:Transcriptional regulator